MSLPRPLLIVLIILLVLFVVSCGIAIARSGEQGQGDADKKQGLNGGFGDLFKRLTPPTAPLRFPPATISPSGSSCSFSGTLLQVNGSCAISFVDLQELRARLLLTRGSGNLTVSVNGTVSGSSVNESTSMPGDTDNVDLVFARGDSAIVTVSCGLGTCDVGVNPPE